MIISIALPHIYLVTYETFSFPVCNRSQYYFPSNYNICSHRFFKCNCLGCVTAIASILSAAIYIQLCNLTLSLLGLLCLPRKKTQSSFAWEHWFYLFQHETPTPAAFRKNVQCWNVCVIRKQGEQVPTLSTRVTRRCSFCLMRDLKAFSIWFSPQQMINVINCIQLLLPPLKSEQLRKRKKIPLYHNQRQLYNQQVSLRSWWWYGLWSIFPWFHEQHSQPPASVA